MQFKTVWCDLMVWVDAILLYRAFSIISVVLIATAPPCPRWQTACRKRLFLLSVGEGESL